MKLSFRQGIARFQTDVLATPTFLQKSPGASNFIDLIVSPDPTVIVFAHKDANYIVEELKTVSHAWGPFSGSGTVYLYWDLNLLTGELTRRSTANPPIYAGTPPSTPPTDQHWFDTSETVMRVWNGAKWIEKIRVLAAYLSSGTIIRPYQLGSQAGINEECEGGNIVLDAYNKPLRQSDGSFVTSATSLIISNNSAKKVKFETEVLSGMADEPLPKYSLVQMRAGRRIILARHTDYMSRIAGIVLEDLYLNEVGYVVSDGLIRNENWNWPASSVNRPVFCGANGEVTLSPPQSGVVQAAGFIYDRDSIYMNIFAPVVLEDVSAIVAPTPLPPVSGAPVTDFYASVTAGTAPLTVSFSSASTNAPSSFDWDFTNDGITDAVTPNPSYTYAAPGTYTVRLRTANAYGSDDEIKPDYVTVGLPSPAAGNTNLGIQLGGPSQVMRNVPFQISVMVGNDGHLTATNVSRVLVIPYLKGERVILSGIPAGSTITNENELSTVTLPVIPTLPSGSSYGPFFFTAVAPTKSGKITISGAVSSAEPDSTVGDNNTSISIEVKP